METSNLPTIAANDAGIPSHGSSLITSVNNCYVKPALNWCNTNRPGICFAKRT